MLLAIDSGNTNTCFAIFDGHNMVKQWRLSTDAKRTGDEYHLFIQSLMQISDVDISAVDSAIISSVVPQNLFSLKEFCRNGLNCNPLVVGEDGVKTGLTVLLDRPSEVGADRLVNAVAAYAEFKRPLIILDFGTATTFDVVDLDGNYLGGVIAPGVNLSLKALHLAAANLPEIAIKKTAKIIGKNTVQAMQSGVYWGYVGMIEGIISRIEEEYGDPMYKIATGGLAEIFMTNTDTIDITDSDLTMNGLRLIYEMNS